MLSILALDIVVRYVNLPIPTNQKLQSILIPFTGVCDIIVISAVTSQRILVTFFNIKEMCMKR
jgi:hypothetical protein